MAALWLPMHPGWQCWTVGGVGGAATGGGLAGWGTGEAMYCRWCWWPVVVVVMECWEQQVELTQLLACIHTCRNSSTRFKTNAPFLTSSDFIHTCSLTVQQLFPGPTFYMC